MKFGFFKLCGKIENYKGGNGHSYKKRVGNRESHHFRQIIWGGD